MKSVVLLSGGLDSSVLLAHLRNGVGGEITALSVDYGQRHRRELWSAFQIARFYGAVHKVVCLPREALTGSTLTGSVGPTSGAPTVVPGRNLILVGVAVAEAVRVGAAAVYLAAHGGDAAVYPDCRTHFTDCLCEAASVGYGVRVLAPFQGLRKADVVARGRELAVPFDLTWSCYDPRGYDPLAPASGSPCDRCGACEERTGALA